MVHTEGADRERKDEVNKMDDAERSQLLVEWKVGDPCPLCGESDCMGDCDGYPY